MPNEETKKRWCS